MTAKDTLNKHLGAGETSYEPGGHIDGHYAYNEVIAGMEEYTAALQERVKELEAALAESEKVNFDLAAHQCDKWTPEENGHWTCRLQAQNDRYRKALEDVIIRLEEDKRFNALSIAKEALKQEVNND